MIRKLMSTAVIAAALTATLTSAAVVAHEHDGYSWHDDREQGDDWGRRDHGEYDVRRVYGAGYDQQRDYYRRGYGHRDDGGQGYYRQHDYYAQPAFGRDYDQRRYYGNSDHRSRCRNDGTTGTILGAIAGGLIGNGVAGHGDRTLGTVIGGGAGAFAGRAIDRGC